MAITTVIICMVLSLWSFIIGMIRKSVPATIVTSLIVIVLRQVIITKNTTNQESIMQVILVAIVTVIATLLIFKRNQGVLLGHCLYQLLAGELIPVCGDNRRFFVAGTQTAHAVIQLIL